MRFILTYIERKKRSNFVLTPQLFTYSDARCASNAPLAPLHNVSVHQTKAFGDLQSTNSVSETKQCFLAAQRNSKSNYSGNQIVQGRTKLLNLNLSADILRTVRIDVFAVK